MSETIKFTINGTAVEGKEGDNVLQVANNYGFDIPSLCYHEAIKPYGACRVCLVEVVKRKRHKLTTSCNYQVQSGIEVLLDTEKVQRNRRLVLELMLAECPHSAELEAIARRYAGLDPAEVRYELDESNDCIRCGLCERVCNEIVGVHAIVRAGRGIHKDYGTLYDGPAEACIACGACVYLCPVGCIQLKQFVDKRIIDRWKREMPMQNCNVCGDPYAPVDQLQYFAKLTQVPYERLETCPNCRPSFRG